MPELPDIIYIKNNLTKVLPGRIITDVQVKNPIVIREIVEGKFPDNLKGLTIKSINNHGTFLKLEIPPYDLVIHFMLVGKIQYAKPDEKPVKDICFTFRLDNDNLLHYGDEKQMGKIYLTKQGEYEKIAGYLDQGVNILSENFTYELLDKLLSKSRQQIRALLIDKKKLSAIGNAYADEILFDAKIFPKTPCNQLTLDEKKKLYESITGVTYWAIDELNKSGKPIHTKIRDHVKIRNKTGLPCPDCGEKIRRLNVCGYDSFFCPVCQPSGDNSKTLW